jgi:hypothetical protein
MYNNTSRKYQESDVRFMRENTERLQNPSAIQAIGLVEETFS